MRDEDTARLEKRARERRQAIKALSLITQVALSALCPIFILTIAGIWLDNKSGGGSHWFTLAGALIGVYSAYRNTYLLIRDSFTEKGKNKDEQAPDGTDK